MVDEIRTAAPVAGAENLALRRQLIKRLTMAGGLVALLLALLALLSPLCFLILCQALAIRGANCHTLRCAECLLRLRQV